MTAGPAEIAAAAQAQAKGETASAAHLRWAEAMQRTVAGSDVAVESPSTPAVDWPGGGPGGPPDLPSPKSTDSLSG